MRYLFAKSSLGSRLQRWVIAVQEFKFKVHHLSGKSNVVADVLSRYPPKEIDREDTVSPEEELMNSWLVFDAVEMDELESKLLKIYEMLVKMSNGVMVDGDIRKVGNRFKLNEKGEMFRKIGERYVRIPKKSERESILKEVHDGHGHFGREATWRRLYLN